MRSRPSTEPRSWTIRGGDRAKRSPQRWRLVDEWPVLVVNADVPAARPRDLLALLGAMPPSGIAITEAEDGTTNALALSQPGLFAPLYGPGSADRFRAHAASQGVDVVTLDVPALADDVDTVAEFEQLRS